MIKHILTIIRNERRSNIPLILELALVLGVLWYIIDGLYVTAKTYMMPTGFDTEHTYLLKLGEIAPSSDLYVERSGADKMNDFRTIYERISRAPMVEAAAISWNSTPHCGSNSMKGMVLDTTIAEDVLDRLITPSFLDVFGYTSPYHTREEMKERLSSGDILVSQSVAKLLVGEGQERSLIGQKLRYSFDETEEVPLTVGGIIGNVRYDHFWRYDRFMAGDITPLIHDDEAHGSILHAEISVRIRPEEDYDVPRRFREAMEDQLHLGNIYLQSITPFDDIRSLFQRDSWREVKNQSVLAGFLLVNIILGMAGIFWFRTQQRRREIGLRLSLGDTPMGVLGQYYLEGALLLLVSTLLPMAVMYALAHYEVLDVRMQDFTAGRYFTGLGISLGLTMLMIILGISVPAHRAISVSPSEVLRGE